MYIGDLPGTEDLDGEALALGESEGTTTVPKAMASAAFVEAITAAIKATNSNETVCPMNASKVRHATFGFGRGFGRGCVGGDPSLARGYQR